MKTPFKMKGWSPFTKIDEKVSKSGKVVRDQIDAQQKQDREKFMKNYPLWMEAEKEYNEHYMMEGLKEKIMNKPKKKSKKPLRNWRWGRGEIIG